MEPVRMQHTGSSRSIASTQISSWEGEEVEGQHVACMAAAAEQTSHKAVAKVIEGVGCTAGLELDNYTDTAALAAALAARCRNTVGLFFDVVCVVAFCGQTVHCQDHHGLVRK